MIVGGFTTGFSSVSGADNVNGGCCIGASMGGVASGTCAGVADPERVGWDASGLEVGTTELCEVAILVEMENFLGGGVAGSVAGSGGDDVGTINFELVAPFRS